MTLLACDVQSIFSHNLLTLTEGHVVEVPFVHRVTKLLPKCFHVLKFHEAK